MLNPNRKKFNSILGRYELNYSIFCENCKKHICDSDFEITDKLCMKCSGEYDRLLSRSGVSDAEIINKCKRL